MINLRTPALVLFFFLPARLNKWFPTGKGLIIIQSNPLRGPVAEGGPENLEITSSRLVAGRGFPALHLFEIPLRFLRVPGSAAGNSSGPKEAPSPPLVIRIIARWRAALLSKPSPGAWQMLCGPIPPVPTV